MRINFKKKIITVDAPGQENRPPSQIKSSAIIDEKLFLQGSDGGKGVRDGLAWSLAIEQNSGKMVFTASGDAVAFVIFGACTTL